LGQKGNGECKVPLIQHLYMRQPHCRSADVGIVKRSCTHSQKERTIPAFTFPAEAGLHRFKQPRGMEGWGQIRQSITICRELLHSKSNCHASDVKWANAHICCPVRYPRLNNSDKHINVTDKWLANRLCELLVARAQAVKTSYAKNFG